METNNFLQQSYLEFSVSHFLHNDGYYNSEGKRKVLGRSISLIFLKAHKQRINVNPYYLLVVVLLFCEIICVVYF